MEVLPLMALGHVGTAKQDLRTVTDMAERVRQPFVLHIADQYRAAIALLEGRLHEAEKGRRATLASGVGCSGAATRRGRTGSRCSGSAASRAGWPGLAPVARSLAAGSGGGGV